MTSVVVYKRESYVDIIPENDYYAFQDEISLGEEEQSLLFRLPVSIFLILT